MKYFIGSVTTRYEDADNEQTFVMAAESKAEAQLKVDSLDWTHGNSIEIQRNAFLSEIPREHYAVLKQYLMVCGEG